MSTTISGTDDASNTGTASPAGTVTVSSTAEPSTGGGSPSGAPDGSPGTIAAAPVPVTDPTTPGAPLVSAAPLGTPTSEPAPEPITTLADLEARITALETGLANVQAAQSSSVGLTPAQETALTSITAFLS